MFGQPLISRTRALGLTSLTFEIRQQLFGGPGGLQIQIRTSTKRGGGSSRNGRDSAGRRLGIKKFSNEYVLPGQILVRQRGTEIHPGQHVGMGKDRTLYALEPGYVKFYTHHLPFPHYSRSEVILSEKVDSVTQSQSSTVIRGLSPVKRPKGTTQFIGIVATKEEALPRQEGTQGRERRFWGWPKTTPVEVENEVLVNSSDPIST